MARTSSGGISAVTLPCWAGSCRIRVGWPERVTDQDYGKLLHASTGVVPQVVQHDQGIDHRSGLAPIFVDVIGTGFAAVVAFGAQRLTRLGELMAMVHMLDDLLEPYGCKKADSNRRQVDEKILPWVR